MKKMIGYKKGVNLGGWLSQSNLSKERLENFITEDDIKNIKKIGCDHVRLPVDYPLIEAEDGTPIESGYVYIDRCTEWCANHGINMILDLHRTFGYAFGDYKNCVNFFNDTSIQDRFYALWDRLSERYGKYNHVAFDLLNEIVDESVKDIWNEIAANAVEHIRKNAKDNYILIGGVNYNHISSIKYLLNPHDDKIVYSFHFYEPHVFTHQGASWEAEMKDDFRVKYPITAGEFVAECKEKLNGVYAYIFDGVDKNAIGVDMLKPMFSEAVQIANERDVPLYCGEYGVIWHSDTESAVNWIRDMHTIFEEYGIGRSIWSYKGMGFGITDENMSTVYDELITLL